MSRRVSSVSLPGVTCACTCACSSRSPGLALSPAAVRRRTRRLGSSIATDLVLPRGVLDHVTKLTLTVTEGNVTCDATAGQTALPGGADAATELAKRDLASDRLRRRREVLRRRLDREVRRAARLLRRRQGRRRRHARHRLRAGHRQSGRAAALHQDVPLSRAAGLRRRGHPADRAVRSPATPRSATRAACRRSCSSRSAATQTGTKDGRPGDKSDPMLLWPAGTAAGTQGRFFAFYTDRAVAGANNFEVSLRAMTADLSPISATELAGARRRVALPAQRSDGVPAGAGAAPAVVPVGRVPQRRSTTWRSRTTRARRPASTSTCARWTARSSQSKGANNPLGINGDVGHRRTATASGSRALRRSRRVPAIACSSPGRTQGRARSPGARSRRPARSATRTTSARAPATRASRSRRRPAAGSRSGRAARASSSASSTRTARRKAASRRSTTAAR